MLLNIHKWEHEIDLGGGAENSMETIHTPTGILKKELRLLSRAVAQEHCSMLLRPNSTEKNNFCQLSSLQVVLSLECFVWQTEPAFPMGVRAIWQTQKMHFIFWRWTFPALKSDNISYLCCTVRGFSLLCWHTSKKFFMLSLCWYC